MKGEFADALEIQRRHFEKQFGLLSSMGFQDTTLPVESCNFEGFSGTDSDRASDSDNETNDENSIESECGQPVSKIRRAPEARVVKLGGGPDRKQVVSYKAQKRFARSGRAPSLMELEAKQERLEKITKKQKLQAAAEDAENLENDLKLQRLLSESHILAHHSESSGADLTLQTLDYEAPIGNARRRILDHRIRAVLATNSSTGGLPKKLERMPMNIRKGIIKARDRRVAEYEREAKEAGIVLAKVKKSDTRVLNQGRGVTVASDRLGSGKKHPSRMRDRGLRINSVGKSTRNGLRISQDEIDRINNQGKKRRRK